MKKVSIVTLGCKVNQVESENIAEELEKLGFKVEVLKCSKPKIKTDKELVVSLKQTTNSVILIVGDFLIDIEGKDGLV